MRYALRLTIFAAGVFSVLSYWGIRAPDSEVVFRTTQALATNDNFSVSDNLDWKGFGLSRGKDGKLYSLFGPGEAIAAVPLYKIAESINRTGWYQYAPFLVGTSHYIDDGLLKYIAGKTPDNLAPHALRTVVCLLNIIVSSMCVFVFYCTIKSLTRSDQSALLTTVLFAFGSLILPYSGTFFSEPLATLFVMLSFFILVRNGGNQNSLGSFSLLASGVSLGLATATHITAILFAPFFCIYGAFLIRKNVSFSINSSLVGAAIFFAGFGLLLLLLGYYNFARFGDVFETGRTVGEMTYGAFVAPWRGLWGLLFGAGKGLIFFCPAIILGLFSWLPFHRKHRFLSFMILGAILLRILFIASRSDWHGGFCLGPRYLVMLIPFLMIPIGELVNEFIVKRNVKAIILFAIFSLACIAQQIYFSIGEVFSFLHSEKWSAIRDGVNIFRDNLIYLSWDYSPLFNLLDGHRGPLLLNSIGFGNYTLWLFFVAVAGLSLLVLSFHTLKTGRMAQLVTINESNQC
jgi:hypothetical protein